MKALRFNIMRVVPVFALFIVAFGVSTPAASTSTASTLPPPKPYNALTFHDAMRKLWEDHITWTRLFIVSDIQNLPDLSANTQRLLQNQDDIGNAIKPFYGDAAGDHLAALLRDHILIAAALIDAVKAQDPVRIQQELDRWYANANDIAVFLNSLNPRQWPLADLQTMMNQHLSLTTTEVLDYYNGNYTASVTDYEAVHLEILEMADTLSTGIMRQFPQLFAPAHLP